MLLNNSVVEGKIVIVQIVRGKTETYYYVSIFDMQPILGTKVMQFGHITK